MEKFRNFLKIREIFSTLILINKLIFSNLPYLPKFSAENIGRQCLQDGNITLDEDHMWNTTAREMQSKQNNALDFLNSNFLDATGIASCFKKEWPQDQDGGEYMSLPGPAKLDVRW
jgi:hypothetical protein